MAHARPLPSARSALVGRAAHVNAVRDLLRSRSARLVTLTGPPGVGKTRLALAVADSVAGEFADRVTWVDLGPLRDASQVPAEIARGLGVAQARRELTLASVADALGDRDALLVTDNYEHLLDAAPVIGELLERLPRLRVLATSRRRLHLLEETEFPVPPLPIPAVSDIDDLDRLARNATVELFLARAPSDVTLTRRTARPVAEICMRLDGLPLALELAAARLRVFTPGELAFRLEHRTAELAVAARDAPARHRTLSAAIEWSHDLLPDAERTAFRRLAVFDGEWTFAAAQAVCDCSSAAALAAIESLLEQSLVHRVPGGKEARFSMLASIHDYAVGQLLATGEASAARDRHARYFAGIASAWEATLGTSDENAEWDAFDAMQSDFVAAFERTSPGETRAWLGIALAWHGYTRGQMAHTATVLAGLHEMDALHNAGDLPGGLSHDARVAMLVSAGVIGFGRAEFTRAGSDLRAALELCAASGDERRHAIAIAFLGHVARSLGNASEAADDYRAARASCERRGNVRGMAWAAFDLGLLAADDEDPAQRAGAEPLLREALVYFEDLGYEWAVAQSTRALATALLDRGAVDEAGRLLARSLALHESAGDRRGSAQCLEALADLAAARGLPPSAARLMGAARVQRCLGATTPTTDEVRRLNAVKARVDSALGRVVADHEIHNGRTAARSAVLRLALDVAEPAAAEDVAAVVLTPRQVEVAGLVASGRTNRQIGRALGISEKTTEIHVSNIMARLNVPSRVGVAAWIARSAPSTAAAE